ncbi:hypothetical protein NW759_017703 [Fusarium solani]|nr:hypothetical protein NW759_017703 [Fusarium solani]
MWNWGLQKEHKAPTVQSTNTKSLRKQPTVIPNNVFQYGKPEDKFHQDTQS